MEFKSKEEVIGFINWYIDDRNTMLCDNDNKIAFRYDGIEWRLDYDGQFLIVDPCNEDYYSAISVQDKSCDKEILDELREAMDQTIEQLKYDLLDAWIANGQKFTEVEK